MMAKRKIRRDGKSRAVEAAIDKDLIRQLRTKIMVNELDPKVISITSSEDGEGKTTIGLNLADAIAAAGKRSLFIDCSLRKENMTGKLGITGIAGISSYLIGALQLKDLIIRQSVGGADLILNVNPSESSSEILEGDVFRQLIEKLRSEYDFVILDTPSMSSCSDAVVVSKLADAIVHVVESDRVSGETVRKDISFLEETKTPVIGIVLNKMEQHG
jgi:capsular exopolysaccharide synthesis family protein